MGGACRQCQCQSLLGKPEQACAPVCGPLQQEELRPKLGPVPQCGLSLTAISIRLSPLPSMQSSAA